MRSFEKTTTVVIAAICILTLVGCTATHSENRQGFMYQDIPVTKKTISIGEGNSVTLHGKNFALSGTGIKVVDMLRHVQVAKKDLSLIDIADTKGTIRIISVVPSLDTKVCEQQTHYLSEKNNGLDKTVELLTVSVDTPFAQDRFAKEAQIQNVTFFSDYRGGQFGREYGLFIQEPHILSRAVLVVDKENIVRYLQVTPELAQMPDMEAAFQVARSLEKSS